MNDFREDGTHEHTKEFWVNDHQHMNKIFKVLTTLGVDNCYATFKGKILERSACQGKAFQRKRNGAVDKITHRMEAEVGKNRKQNVLII